jgi:hypothetical protein
MVYVVSRLDCRGSQRELHSITPTQISLPHPDISTANTHREPDDDIFGFSYVDYIVFNVGYSTCTDNSSSVYCIIGRALNVAWYTEWAKILRIKTRS